MKNLKLLGGLNAVLVLMACFLASACQKLETEMNSKQPSGTLLARGQYSVVFGHVGGFCKDCDVLYKIKNDTVYTTKFSTNLDPKTAVFSFLTVVDSFSLAGSLPYSTPPKLLEEQSTVIGTYRPDLGHYYIEVRIHDSIHHWYVEASNVPDYLTSYLADIQKVMNDLR